MPRCHRQGLSRRNWRWTRLEFFLSFVLFFFLWIRISFPDPESCPDMDEEEKDEPDRQAHDTPGGQAEGGPDRQAGTEQIAR
jgi:hypothetical protein